MIFLRKIIRGGADDSFGIEVAHLAGVPGCIIKRAKKIMAMLEGGDAVQTRKYQKAEEPSFRPVCLIWAAARCWMKSERSIFRP